VALHPAPGAQKPVLTPIFFGTGTKDHTVPDWSVRLWYDSVSGQPKVFANIEGAEHGEPEQKDRWLPYTISMLNCHILGQSYDCENVYGTSTADPCSLCTCPDFIPTSVCKHKNEPDFMPII